MKKQTVFLLLSAAAFTLLSWQAARQNTSPKRDTVRQAPKTYYNISISGHDTVLAVEHLKLGEAMFNAGLLDSARSCFFRALEVYDKTPGIETDSALLTWKLNAMFWAGFLSESLNDLSTAEKLLRECIEKATTRFTTRHYILSFTFIKLGYIYIDRGDVYKGYELIKNSYEIRAETMHDSTIWMRNGHGNMAWICDLTGKYDEALFHRKKLYDIAYTYQLNQPANLASANLGLANTYEKMGQPEKAAPYLKEGLRLLQNAYPPGHPGNTSLHYYLMDEYFREKNFAAAIKLIPQTIELSKKRYGPYHPSIAGLFNKLGEAFQLNQQPDSALFYHQQALVALLPALRDAGYLEVPENIDPGMDGYVLEAMRKKASALTRYHDLSEKQDMNYLRSALRHYLACIRLMDERRMNFLSLASKEVQNEDRFGLFEEALALALRLHEMTGEENYLQQAFFITEKSKAMALLESVRGNQLDELNLLPGDLKQQEYEIKSRIAYLQHQLTTEKSRPDSVRDTRRIRELSQQAFEASLSYDSLVAVFKARYPDYFKMLHNAEVATLAQLQEQLPEGTALLEYFTGDSLLVLFAISKKEVFVHSQRINERFFTQVNQLRRLMDEPPTARQQTVKEVKAQFETFVDLSGGLYRTLLSPALERLDTRQLVIIPDGVLSYLPFEALLTGKPEELTYNYRRLPYLFLEHSTRYEYSATLLLEPRKKQPTKELYAGFAPAYNGDELLASRGEDSLLTSRAYSGMFRNGGLESLRYNQDEIRESGSHASGATFLGQQAQERYFLEKAGQARILHLAMHALTNDEEPSFSQLVFSLPDDTLTDGKLHAFELYHLHLRAELAVLSACHTGAGKLRRGEGMMSLGRAFRFAGCPNLVTSLWKADDFSTKTLITSFFENLKNGMGKDAALQAARRRFLLEEAPEERTHPFYWSTFVLFGDDQPVPLGKSNWWWWVVIGGVLVAVLLRRRYLLRNNGAA